MLVHIHAFLWLCKRYRRNNGVKWCKLWINVLISQPKTNQKNYNKSNSKTIKSMSKTFIIGDREKNEWISVFNESEKVMS